ncbi:hypothetical protein Tco_1015602 [Tanacetum coccineum]|uniref:Uncharacterized protein n=1 Tax=Tanacetum coccineum TaxID=301880 RepID=A0ABQ5FN48_9ASTR
MTTFAVMCKAYGGEPSVDLLRSFLSLGRAGDWLTLSNRGGADVPKALIKPVTHLENWKDSLFYIENKIIPYKYPKLLLEDNKLDKKSFKDKIPVQPQTDPLYTQISTYPCIVRTFLDPILHLACLKTSWKYRLKMPIIYYRGQEMDFRSFMIQGVYGEFNFLPEEGFNDNQGSLSAKSVNNETSIIDAEPISIVLPLNVTDNIIDSSNTSSDDELPPMHPSTSSFPEVGEKSKAVGKRKLAADALQEGSHHRARKAPVQASKVSGDASTPLYVDSDPDIHGKFEPVYGVFVPSLTTLLMPFPFLLIALIQSFLLEIKRDKAYAELEKKCNEALQDLDKNPLVSDMRSEIKTLQGRVNGLYNEYGMLLLKERKWANYEQTLSILYAKVKGLESERERLKASEIQVLQEIDSLRQDKAAIVSKVVPNATMKLVHSDEMGVLVSRLVREAIIHGRCATFVVPVVGYFLLDITQL